MNQELRILDQKRVMIHKTRGFTLIEVLIVIAVIGVMAIGAVNVINPLTQLQKANDSRRKSDLSQVQKALEVYYQDYGKYPDAVDNKIKRSDGGTCSGNTCAADWGSTLWAPYMSTLPKDPNSSRNYVYNSTSGQSYYIYASLDREATSLSNLPAGASCGTGTCNYGVSSPNVSP